jgi:hypothetical protein
LVAQVSRIFVKDLGHAAETIETDALPPLSAEPITAAVTDM